MRHPKDKPDASKKDQRAQMQKAEATPEPEPSERHPSNCARLKASRPWAKLVVVHPWPKLNDLSICCLHLRLPATHEEDESPWRPHRACEMPGAFLVDLGQTINALSHGRHCQTSCPKKSKEVLLHSLNSSKGHEQKAHLTSYSKVISQFHWLKVHGCSCPDAKKRRGLNADPFLATLQL